MSNTDAKPWLSYLIPSSLTVIICVVLLCVSGQVRALLESTRQELHESDELLQNSNLTEDQLESLLDDDIMAGMSFSSTGSLDGPSLFDLGGYTR